MDASVSNEIIKRITLWYRWQLSYSEKRIFLRRFPRLITIGFSKLKVPGIALFIEGLVISLDTTTFVSRPIAVNRLFRIFDYIDTNKKVKDKTHKYYTPAEIHDRADTFISEFDTMMRDILLSEQSTLVARKIKKGTVSETVVDGPDSVLEAAEDVADEIDDDLF